MSGATSVEQKKKSQINNKFEGIWKKVFVVLFKIQQ
jgi:hypothetical protein